ncbi:MAG: hypothetical protein PVH88_24090 [Ignavibacteria bacterium]|jgi:hypothetical protein
MNKAILKEAIKSGIKVDTNNVVYNSRSMDINKFLYEVTKLQFTRPLSICVNICKEKFFKVNNRSEF